MFIIKLGGIELRTKFFKLGVLVSIFMLTALIFKLNMPYAKDTNKDVDVVTQTLKENYKGINFDIKYPEVNLSDEHVKNKINASLKQSVYDFKKYIEDIYNETNSLYSGDADKSLDTFDYEGSSEFEYEIVGNILSIKMKYVQFTGGAHPMTHVRGFNFDLKTGNDLKLEEIFNDKGKKEYIDLINKEIMNVINKNPDNYFVEEFKGIGNNTEYYLTKDGLNVFFQLYEIAPYSAGIPEFLIPYSKIKDKLNIGV